MTIDLDLLRTHVANGVVNRRDHPALPLSIYNYSPRCQYDRLWDAVSRQARGLVLHGDTIVARPLPKFFNDAEHAPEEIPWHLPSEVTEKLDGSLLIVFYFDGGWHFATRGSFTSPQAVEGRRIFLRKYVGTVLNPAITYLFEVVYPKNKIVVNYGSTEDAVLLAMMDTKNGGEIPLRYAPVGLNVVRRLSADTDAQNLRTLIRDDAEGYVIRFANGFRVKVKGERYIYLHRLITGTSSRTVWEYLSQNKPIDEMLAYTPDEFNAWVRREATEQQAAFNALIDKALAALTTIIGLPTRKDRALALLNDHEDVAHLVFAMLDGKVVAPIVWEQLYPAYRRPEIAERLES